MIATAPHPKNNTPSRILVVDPRQVDYDWLVRRVVASRGQVRFLATGRAVLRQGHDPATDLYLVNVRLPDFSGCDLVEMLRPFPPGAAVFLVADGYVVEDEIRALKLGVSGYLCKPLEPSLLGECRIGKKRKEVIGHETFFHRKADP